MKILDSKLARYLLVGVVNTIFGYGIIFALMFGGVAPEVANLVGYLCGFLLSYFLNKTFTFGSKASHKRDFTRFLIAMSGAYMANLAVLILCYRALNINEYLAQILAGIAYTACGFVFNKFFAFRGV